MLLTSDTLPERVDYEDSDVSFEDFDTYEHDLEPIRRNNGPSVNRAVAPTNMRKVVEGKDALLALRKLKYWHLRILPNHLFQLAF